MMFRSRHRRLTNSHRTEMFDFVCIPPCECPSVCMSFRLYVPSCVYSHCVYSRPPPCVLQCMSRCGSIPTLCMSDRLCIYIPPCLPCISLCVCSSVRMSHHVSIPTLCISDRFRVFIPTVYISDRLYVYIPPCVCPHGYVPTVCMSRPVSVSLSV